MRLKLLLMLVFFAFLVSCSDPSEPYDGVSSGGGNGSSNGSSGGSSAGSSGGSSAGSNDVAVIDCQATSDALDRTRADLGLGNVILVKYNNGSAPTIDNPNANEVTVSVTGENVVVTVSSSTLTTYNFVVSGATTNGSLKIYGEFRIGIYLNGVKITNPRGPAINIQNGKRIGVNLVGGTENFIADASGYSTSENEQEQAKGTFFSEGQLVFSGSGYLGVRGKNAHAIISDDHINIESGCIAVTEAERDGIHANDDITISGGIINITSKGDAIQSERLAVIVSGGQITAKTSGIKSHGIVSGDSTAKNTPRNGRTSIKDNAKIDITVNGNGSKGINSAGYTEILGGTINIQVNGGRHIETSPRDTSNAAGIKSDDDVWIEGGNLTIKSPGNFARGIKADLNFIMTGGTINIDADDDGIKADGNLDVRGGSGTVKSKRTTALDCATGKTCNKGSLVTTDGGF